MPAPADRHLCYSVPGLYVKDCPVVLDNHLSSQDNQKLESGCPVGQPIQNKSNVRRVRFRMRFYSYKLCFALCNQIP